MPQIGYRQWGLIPGDLAPGTGQLSTGKPPMMTALALDKNASLVFKLAKTAAPLLIQVEVTALSGEKSTPPFLQIYASADGEQYHLLEPAPWEKTSDGLYLIFSTQIEKPETFIKLLHTQSHILVVNKVTFSTS